MRSSTWRSSSPRTPVDAQLRQLADLEGGLADDARESLRMLRERNHARAHEPVLEFGSHARLLHEQALRILRGVRHQLLDAGEVAQRFGQRARELLQRGVAVELERIEIAMAWILVLVSESDLRLRLQFELAQLFAQARNCLRQLAQVEVDGAELLLEPSAEDADLAGVVQQALEQRGVDARELAPLARCRRAAGRAGSGGGLQTMGATGGDAVGAIVAATRGGGYRWRSDRFGLAPQLPRCVRPLRSALRPPRRPRSLRLPLQRPQALTCAGSTCSTRASGASTRRAPQERPIRAPPPAPPPLPPAQPDGLDRLDERRRFRAGLHGRG